jgi:S1-C subfamily serine protease
MDIVEQFSAGLADRVARAAPIIVAIRDGQRWSSGILWRPDVVVASEQMIGETPTVMRGGVTVGAALAGRDPGTNVAVLKLDKALEGTLPPLTAVLPVGALVLLAGADAAGGPTGRLAMVHAVGEAWHSMAGGRIDALIRLDCRLGADEGGPVLALDGGLVGMSTSGPRRRTIVIPAATLARVIDPLLADGRIPRGWLGIGLQPVMIPDAMRQSAGHDSGLMVVSLAPAAPAQAAGILPGDIVLAIDGAPVSRPRALTATLGPERIGQDVVLLLLRAGTVHSISVIVAARPAA